MSVALSRSLYFVPVIPEKSPHYTPRAGGHKFGHIESRPKGSIFGFIRVENLVSHILRVLKVLRKASGGLFWPFVPFVCPLFHKISSAHPK